MPVTVIGDNDKHRVYSMRSFYGERIVAYSDSQVVQAWRLFIHGRFTGSYIDCLSKLKIEPRTAIEDQSVYIMRCSASAQIANLTDRELLTAFDNFRKQFPPATPLPMSAMQDFYDSLERANDNSGRNTK